MGDAYQPTSKMVVQWCSCTICQSQPEWLAHGWWTHFKPRISMKKLNNQLKSHRMKRMLTYFLRTNGEVSPMDLPFFSPSPFPWQVFLPSSREERLAAQVGETWGDRCVQRIWGGYSPNSHDLILKWFNGLVQWFNRSFTFLQKWLT